MQSEVIAIDSIIYTCPPRGRQVPFVWLTLFRDNPKAAHMQEGEWGGGLL